MRLIIGRNSHYNKLKGLDEYNYCWPQWKSKFKATFLDYEDDADVIRKMMVRIDLKSFCTQLALVSRDLAMIDVTKTYSIIMF